MTGQKEVSAPVLTSKDIALAELDRINGLGLIEKGNFKEFNRLTADCLKRFVCNGIHIPPSGFTTAGLLRHIKISDGLKDILQDCDLVEFANYSPTVEESLFLIKGAKKGRVGE